MSLIENYHLNKSEQKILENICADIRSTLKDNKIISSDIIALCDNNQRSYKLALANLTEFITQQLTSNKHCGAVLVNNLPNFYYPEITTVILGNILGNVIKEYDDGVWIKQIKVEPDFDTKIDRPSARDTREFHLHTDLTYIENPPPYFLFNCISNPSNLGGSSIFCGLENILQQLPTSILEILNKKIFLFPTPYYYTDSNVINNSILSKDKNNQYYIRFRRDGIRSTNKEGINAISQLTHLLEENKIVHDMRENTALYINNRRCLHGRLSFIQTGHKSRHFMQVYIK